VTEESLKAIAIFLSTLEKDLVEIRQTLEKTNDIIAEGVNYFLNK
jgi:hypothetical protein